MRRIRRRLESLLTTDQFTYPELRKMFLTLLLDQRTQQFFVADKKAVAFNYKLDAAALSFSHDHKLSATIVINLVGRFT